MTKLGDWRYWWGNSPAGRVAQFSPDSTQFVVVVRKGNLERNTNEYSLQLWSSKEVFQSPSPEVPLIMSSSSNRGAINDVTWLDSERVAFRGEHPGELQQVYICNLRTRTLNKLTNHPTSAVSYTITPNGDLAYTAEEPIDSIFSEKARREGFHVSTQYLDLLIRGQSGDRGRGNFQLFFQPNGQRSRRLGIQGRIPAWYGIPYLSPNKKYIVLRVEVAKIPEIWKEYSDPFLKEWTEKRLAPGQYSWLSRYILVNISTGEARVLLDAPISDVTQVLAWSPNSNSIVIPGVYLPLDNTSGDERKARQSHTFTVEVNVQSGEITKIGEDGLRLLRWDAKTNRIIFETGRVNQDHETESKTYFRKTGEKWEKLPEFSSDEGRPEIVLEEDMNSSPKLVAVNRKTDQRALLFDLNPQFKELKFGRVEEITWTASDGHEVKGGLYYPVDYVPGKRYPLVIQTHGWDPTKFWIDGPWTTAFAAQPLAGKGIMVIQSDASDADRDTPKEVEREVATLEGAIDHLDRKGLIDRSRVGIIGFSRTCAFVKYALSHSASHFAAASVTDGVDGGYYQYTTYANTGPDFTKFYEGTNGGAPFGDGLKMWMIRSPGFNTYKVQTPLRIVALRPDDTLFEWEWFAALYSLKKPVEFVIIQDGEHALQKPWDRMVSQQGNVDWFVFWLNGEEDPDPAKAEQYQRWRELRKLQEHIDAKTQAAPAN